MTEESGLIAITPPRSFTTPQLNGDVKEVISDELWEQDGGPSVDQLEDAAHRLAQTTGMTHEQVLKYLCDTAMERVQFGTSKYA